MTETQYMLICLNAIDDHYINVMGYNRNDEVHQQAAENAFTAELYHILRVNQIEYDERNKLIWHFDLNKERAKSIRPDLVLHASPENRDDQRIFIEIKTNSNTTDSAIQTDYKKLNKAVTANDNAEKLGFKIGFYVVAQINKENIKRNLSFVDVENWSKIKICYLEGNEFVKLELNEL